MKISNFETCVKMYKFYFKELAPQIITKLKDQKVATGEQVLFEIELTKGDALVKWTKDNKEIQLNNNVRLTIDGKRQKLEIVRASKTDTGVYECQVHKQTCAAKLTVEGNSMLKYNLNCVKICISTVLSYVINQL